MDLEAASGRKHHVIAVPAIFVIDGTGVVRWAHADPNYRVRPTTQQLLAVLDGLGSSPTPSR
jgi:peroxiredoxin